MQVAETASKFMELISSGFRRVRLSGPTAFQLQTNQCKFKQWPGRIKPGNR